MNREEQIKMWEQAAKVREKKIGHPEKGSDMKAKYGSVGAEAIRGFEANASRQGRPLSAQERAAMERHEKNKADADAKIAAAKKNK